MTSVLGLGPLEAEQVLDAVPAVVGELRLDDVYQQQAVVAVRAVVDVEQEVRVPLLEAAFLDGDATSESCLEVFPVHTDPPGSESSPTPAHRARKKRVARLGPSQATRDKTSRTLAGRKTPEAVKEKIRQSLLGRKHTEEAIEKMRIKRRARPPRTPEQVLKEARRVTAARSAKRNAKLREQYIKDLYAAHGHLELFLDVKQSWGWASDRRVHDTTGAVSDGMLGKGDRILRYATDPSWSDGMNGRRRIWWEKHFVRLKKEPLRTENGPKGSEESY